ncbi:hypothetical protein ANN_06574 [Periplaneta americana]|uniref:Uncharacterized protein n=1 Tax=Periplaneta americana TaxID=6978 RepID=A0ABQ8TDX6_PERAM|nr:hypothetical protein ANN_06574 [Periplaneta americana]
MAAISSQQCQPKKFSGKDVSIQLNDNSIHQNKSLSNKDSATNNFHPNSKIMNPKDTPSNQVTYSKVLQSTPSRDQAIIFESSDNITIKDYVLAVGKLTDPSNIRFISRISNGRICIYLASKKIVEELTTKYQQIMINNESLQLRPFLTKYKRVILSNVCPVIPHSLIEESLLQFDVKPMSPIEYIKAGISTPGFSHILSFRRQMYVQPDDFETRKYANLFSDDSEELLNNIPNEDATIPILTQKEKSKPPKKKAKALNSPSIDESLLSIRTIVESSPNDYVLNFLQLKSFYENAVGTTDILDVAKSHTHDIEGLIDTLHKLYPHFKSQNMKNKTTRILTKLTSHSNTPEHDTLT